MLNNATRAGFDVRPTLYSLDGNAAALAPIHLAAHETKTIDLGQWVAQLGGKYTAGSLRLDYESVGFGLGAMVMMVNEPESLEIDVLARSQQMFKSADLEAIWWAADPQTRVQFAVQNTTESQVTGTLSLTGAQGGGTKSVPLRLGAHETQVFSLRELVDPDRTSVGGISIRHGAQPGALMAQGFALQPQTGFSANFPFQDPATFGDSTLEGAGVFVGHEDTAPGAPLFSGHLLIRNTSSDPLTASPILQRGQFQQPLAPVRLQPGEAREILVPADFLPDRPGATSIEIKHTGPAGGLLGYWFSVDPSGSLVVETPLRSPMPFNPRGGNNPWMIDGDSSSVLYVKNTGVEKSGYVASIRYPGGEYMIGLKEVSPGETSAIDFRRLRDEQVPDVTGHRLPRDLLSGQVLWTWHSGAALVGRVNTMSLSKGLASNMSCGRCCDCPSTASISLSPSSSTGPIGGSVQEVPWETDSDNCNGPRSFPLSPGSVTWSSSNVSVASVASSGVVSCLSRGFAQIAGNGTVSFGQIDNSREPGSDGCFFCVQVNAPSEGDAGVTVCDFDLSPEGSVTASSCDGTTSNRQTFVAIGIPSGCQVVPSESSCSGFSSGGNVSVQSTTNNISSLSASCQVQYTASGVSGQSAGRLGFTMRLSFYPSSAVVAHTVRPSVNCP
jgi:hypothetical protein